MATTAKPTAQKPQDPTVPKKSNKKLFLIIGGVLVLALAGGGGWYFTKGKDHEAHVEEVKVVPPKPPIFSALEPFTVNLQSENSDQYLQMGISMKMFDPEVEAKIKLNLPEIRSKILQLLTTKSASELLTAEGKSKLVKEIVTMSNAVIGIYETPAPAKVAPMPSQTPVTSPAGTPGGEASHADSAEAAHATEPALAPNPAAHKPVEKKGIVDVLFTSFIIQ
jgi:flagellar protein FliL